jgi:hypothetical protein
MVFGTGDENLPKAYMFVLPKLVMRVTTIPMTDNKKYINAGVHNSFKVFGKAIFIKYINIKIYK